MIRSQFTRSFTALILAGTIAMLPALSIGQTRVSMPKNKYKVQDDVKLGNDAARQVEQQFPLVNDAVAQRYIESVGQRLVAAIPPEFQQPAFNYRFKIVNASDINAFALPGGPMFVNRGMIEAAKNEGEMAGVMAHEMSHVALRHATAQRTKMNSPLNQILGVGAVLAGGQLGELAVGSYFLKFSREYEKEADLLGARIMANAGYDPHDLANMFQTIEAQGGGRAPQWLSDHPNPGNRYQYINQEAARLPVSPNPIKITQGFSRTQEKLRSMPRARSMSQIEQGVQQGQRPVNTSSDAGGRYSTSVSLPSTRTREFSNNWLQINVPYNWRDLSSGNTVQVAPEGGYGDHGMTHGALIGIDRSGSGNAQQATQTYVTSVLQENNYLRQKGAFTRFNLSGRQGYTVALAGLSPVTNRMESVTVYTALLSDGSLLYVATVSPQDESYRYSNAFRNMLASIHVND